MNWSAFRHFSWYAVNISAPKQCKINLFLWFCFLECNADLQLTGITDRLLQGMPIYYCTVTGEIHCQNISQICCTKKRQNWRNKEITYINEQSEIYMGNAGMLLLSHLASDYMVDVRSCDQWYGMNELILAVTMVSWHHNTDWWRDRQKWAETEIMFHHAKLSKIWFYMTGLFSKIQLQQIIIHRDWWRKGNRPRQQWNSIFMSLIPAWTGSGELQSCYIQNH